MRLFLERSVGHEFPNDLRGVAGLQHSMEEVTYDPAPTIVAQRPTRIMTLDEPADPIPAHPDRPARYPQPGMRSLRERKRNGYTVASTFTGCGGSCLGFLAAGYQTLVATEFVEEARATYRANFPKVPIIEDDVRDVTGKELARHGQPDVLEGSPPCSAFSMAGKRQGGWGESSSYSDTAQRTDDLFWEFARLVRAVQPKVFVAENVPGLVTGKAKGYYLDIRHELASAGYRVDGAVLDSQWLNTATRRKRLIIIGVRADLHDYETGDELVPTFPKPNSYNWPLGVVLPHLLDPADDPVWAKDGHAYDPETGDRIDIRDTALFDDWRRHRARRATRYINSTFATAESPSPVVTASAGGRGTAGVMLATTPRKFTLAELRRISGFPADFKLTGPWGRRWERIGRAVPPPLMEAVASTIQRRILDRVDDRS